MIVNQTATFIKYIHGLTDELSEVLISSYAPIKRLLDMNFFKISKIAIGFFALGLAAASPSVFAQNQAADQVVAAQKLPDIRTGMTKTDVEKVLGKPVAAPVWLSGANTWVYRTDLDSGMRYDVDFGADGKVIRAGLYRANETGNS